MYLVPRLATQRGHAELERRKRALELAVLQYQTLVVEDDPYGDLYFRTHRRLRCWH